MFINKLNAPMSKSIALALFTAASSLVLSSCQDEDYGYTPDQIAYQTNFQKAYGKISEIPTWDLSTYNLKKMGLEGGPSNDHAAIGGAQTRAFTASASEIMKAPNVEWYSVQDLTLNWLNTELAEKVPHQELGSAFTLINPFWDENKPSTDRWDEFLIIPIYQGATGMTWDLHIVDDQYDYTIWQKSQDFKYTIHHNKWEEFFFRDLSNRSISLKDAFQGVPSYNEVYVSFMPNAGTMGGRFFVTDGKYSERAYITDLSDLSFAASNTKDLNSVSLKSVIGKSYSRNDGNGSVTAALTNLFFEPSGEKISYDLDNPQKPDYVYATPYPAERLHVWVRFDNPTPETTPGELYNFTQSKKALRPNGSNSDSNVTYFEGHTINRSDVQSKVMRIDASKLGREFSLYLETKYSDQYNQSYSKEGVKHRSNGDPKMMLAIHEFNGEKKPINFEQTLTDLGISYTSSSDYEYMVIGCEDANGSASDWDYNDVVLLFVGLPKVPKVATNVVQKRYMIEDLGSTFDFDFNDIVVDVTDEQIVTIGTGSSVHKQIVSIAHLCGTIPFDVHFLNEDGSTTTIFNKLMGQNNGNGTGGAGFDPRSDRDYINKYVKVYEESSSGTLPWRPNDNNIVVYVWPDAAGLTEATGTGHSSLYGDGPNNLLDIKKAQRIDFPQKGQFPYIIAVDQDINWMPELHSVPEAWFKTEHITDRYPENGENPSINVPTKPNPTPDVEDYGVLIADSYMDNVNGITTVRLGEFLTDKYVNPGRDLTFTVVLSSSCLPSSTNSHSTAVPEVKGEFVLSRQTEAEKLYDAAVNLKDFAKPEGNNDIIIQQFTLIDALTIDDVDDANDEYLLSVANAKRLLFNINYATYGFKDVGSGNPQAKLYVSWDKRPALKLTLADPQETASFTVRQNGKTVQNTNGVYLVDANTSFTIAGNQDCKYLWYDGDTKKTEKIGNTASDYITIGNTDTELTVKVYHPIIPELHNYIGEPVTEENRSLLDQDANYNGRITSSNDCKITLTWSSANGGDNSSSTSKLYVPVNATVNVDLTLTDSKYELVGWKWGNKSHGTDKSFTITKANRETEYTPQAAIRDLSVMPKLTFNIADTDKDYIEKIYVNNQELTITDGSAATNVAAGESLNFRIVHNNGFGTYEVVYEVVTATAGYTNWFVLNDKDTQFETMPSSDLTFSVSAKYQVQAYINGAYNEANDGMGTVTITYGDNQTTEEKQVWLKTGSSYAFSAAPKTGYRFTGWENNPSLSGTVAHSRVFVNALFEEDSYHITVHASYEHGTVKINSGSAAKSVEGDYNSGAQLTLTATPNTGYYFVNWSLGSRYSQITHTVSAEKTIWANFAEGTSIFDCGATAASLVGSEYPKLDKIKNDSSVDGAVQNFNALKTALTGKTSATLRIYCDNGDQSRTVHILRHGKNWSGITEMTSDNNNNSNKYYIVQTSGENQGIVDIPLTQEAITNLLSDSEGLVIQNNTNETNVELKIIRVVVF